MIIFIRQISIVLAAIILAFSGPAFSSQQDEMPLLINKTLALDPSLPIILENGAEEEYRNYIGNLDMLLRESISTIENSGETGMFLNAKKQSATSFVDGKKELAGLLFDLSKSNILLGDKNIQEDDALKIKKIFSIIKFFSEKKVIDRKSQTNIITYLDKNIARVAIHHNKNLVLNINNPEELSKEKKLLVYNNKPNEWDIIVIQNEIQELADEKPKTNNRNSPATNNNDKTIAPPPKMNPYQQIHREPTPEQTSLKEFINRNGQDVHMQYKPEPLQEEPNPHSVRIIFYSKNFMRSLYKNNKIPVEKYQREQAKICSNIESLYPNKADTAIEWIVDETTKSTFEDLKKGGIIYTCNHGNTMKPNLTSIEQQDNYKNIISTIEIDEDSHSCSTKNTIIDCLNDINSRLYSLHTS